MQSFRKMSGIALSTWRFKNAKDDSYFAYLVFDIDCLLPKESFHRISQQQLFDDWF